MSRTEDMLIKACRKIANNEFEYRKESETMRRIARDVLKEVEKESGER